MSLPEKRQWLVSGKMFMEVIHNHICLFPEGREEAQRTEQGEERRAVRGADVLPHSWSQPITSATTH